MDYSDSGKLGFQAFVRDSLLCFSQVFLGIFIGFFRHFHRFFQAFSQGFFGLFMGTFRPFMGSYKQAFYGPHVYLWNADSGKFCFWAFFCFLLGSISWTLLGILMGNYRPFHWLLPIGLLMFCGMLIVVSLAFGPFSVFFWAPFHEHSRAFSWALLGLFIGSYQQAFYGPVEC